MHWLLRLVAKKSRTCTIGKGVAARKSLINTVPAEGAVFWILQRYVDALDRVGVFTNREVVPGAAPLFHPGLLRIDATEGVVDKAIEAVVHRGPCTSVLGGLFKRRRRLRPLNRSIKIVKLTKEGRLTSGVSKSNKSVGVLRGSSSGDAERSGMRSWERMVELSWDRYCGTGA